MSQVILYIKKSKENKFKVLDRLQTLEQKFRPEPYNTFERRDKKKRVDNKEKFYALLELTDDILLFAKECSYNIIFNDISYGKGNYIELCLWPKARYSAPKYLKELFSTFAKLEIVYGYACKREEFEHKNKYAVELSNGGTVFHFGGLMLTSKIPGLYSFTLFSDEILEMFNMNSKDIETEAKEAIILKEGLTLFIISPIKQWEEHKERVDDFCDKHKKTFFPNEN